MECGVIGALRAIKMRRDVGITPYGIGRNGCIPLLITGDGGPCRTALFSVVADTLGGPRSTH